MRRKQVVAMLLAGGKGSRLLSLTSSLAKPAVPFGGKYRIIDFPLSNCTNSGIDTVGVLTQYEPLVLHSYIGIGSAWDLDRKDGGVTVLPPYAENNGLKWYSGTASAIYQNLSYLNQYDPEYTLILSGDHIYKMDYSKLVDFHIEKNADLTISVIEVPIREASRFGIMNTNEDMEIVEFVEKPEKPESNLASMGVYIFKTDVLRSYLTKDNKISESSNDFGKDIIPKIIDDGKKVFAYPFKGYWKDVGTIQSLWEANMDLLSENSELDLYDPSWRIYSVNQNYQPQFLSSDAVVRDSLINEGCFIQGNIEKSVIFQGVKVGNNSTIRDSVIMSDTVIGDNVFIENAIVGNGITIPNGYCVKKKKESDEAILIN